MESKTYKTRSGSTQYRPIMSESEYHAIDNEGFCLACGMEAFNVEPDARECTCESCGAPKVYGLEELLIMDLLTIQFEDGECTGSGRKFKETK